MTGVIHADLLRDMVLFVELARTLNLSRAARTLGMPPSSLSRRITEMERKLGVKLFHRSTRRTELTEAGALYFEKCDGIVETALRTADELHSTVGTPKGLLRISSPVDFMSEFLASPLARFARLYPEIEFDFDLSPRRVDLLAESIDVAIRIGLLPDSTLIARRIATLRNRLFAAPSYLAKHGIPQHPQDLAKHQCINVAHLQEQASRWTLERGDASEQIDTHGRIVANNVGLIRQFAVEGFGIAQLFEAGRVARSVAAGELVPVLSEWRGRPLPVHAITKTRVLPAKTRLFVEFLVQETEAQFGLPAPTLAKAGRSFSLRRSTRR